MKIIKGLGSKNVKPKKRTAIKKGPGYRLTKREKDFYYQEWLCKARSESPSLPDRARVVKYPSPSKQSNFWESLLLLWAENRNYNAAKVDVKGTWRPELQRFTYSATTKGFPDVPMTIYGFSVMVEVKAPGDDQSDEQKEMERRQKEAHGYYLIFDSLDRFDDLEKLADKLRIIHEKIRDNEQSTY